MLRDKFKEKKVITFEILLPTNIDIKNLINELQPFKGLVDALNIPSNPLGKLRPDALCFAHILQENLGIETIPHFVARHYTLLSFESQLLGARALGIENILCVTGDSPVEGRSMFELNASKLLEVAKNLRDGLTSARKTITPIDFCLCTSFNPNVPNLQGEFIKAGEKFRCGAEVFFTQPVFQPDRFVEIIKELRSRLMMIKVVAGLTFLYTKKRAFSLMKFLGIPYQYITSIEEVDENELLFETAQKLNEYVDGFYIITIGKYQNGLELIKKIRKMKDF
ncbi:MAG: methylenetetrahydrofolate reductase [candidate division WOR-3 bacterium]|nr:methylenetetrahydrofolate reductase [candidate division WOR-3 bacterium]